MYVLPYSLAFGFVRVSSGPAKAVAQPATSKVARVKNCMIAEFMSSEDGRYLESVVWVDLNLGFEGRGVYVCLDVLFNTGGEIKVFIVCLVPLERLLSARVSSLCWYIWNNMIIARMQG